LAQQATADGPQQVRKELGCQLNYNCLIRFLSFKSVGARKKEPVVSPMGFFCNLATLDVAVQVRKKKTQRYIKIKEIL
jgi:hypothetical protein